MTRILAIMLLAPIIACTSCDSPGADQPTDIGGSLPATTGPGQQRQLHAVLEELVEERVEGYVVVSKAAFEYPSIDRARVDGSVDRSCLSKTHFKTH